MNMVLSPAFLSTSCWRVCSILNPFPHDARTKTRNEVAGGEVVAQTLERVGIAFLFAPALHPAMAEIMPVRRELGIRTVFNLLGPLANPAGARRQVVGV